MANRQMAPTQKTTPAMNAVLVALVAICSAPALAATTSRIPCSEAVEATLTVLVDDLIAEVVSHDLPAPSINDARSIDEIEVVSSTSLLAPRAEAAIRDAFDESDRISIDSSDANLSRFVLTPPMAGKKSAVETTDKVVEGPASGMNTKLPGISDDDLSRYRKQMYRRDI